MSLVKDCTLSPRGDASTVTGNLRLYLGCARRFIMGFFFVLGHVSPQGRVAAIGCAAHFSSDMKGFFREREGSGGWAVQAGLA